MSNFAILRTKKLKSKGNISGMGSHVSRTRDTPNADTTIENMVLAGSGKMLADYEARMDELDIPKIRKNAVLAVDFMMTASHEFFLKDGKKRDDDKVAEFATRSIDWLEKKWGKNLVSATLHLDEKTPHIHAVIIPEKDGKLNAREFFGGREKMSAMQDDFYSSVADLGLDRGLKGSKAKHQTVQKYYSQLNQVEALDNQNQELNSKNKSLENDVEKLSDELGVSKMVNAVKGDDLGQKIAERRSQEVEKPKKPKHNM